MTINRSNIVRTLQSHLAAFESGEVISIAGNLTPVRVLAGFEQEYGLEPISPDKKFDVDKLREVLVARRTSLLQSGETSGRDLAEEIQQIGSSIFANHKLTLAQEINDRLSEAGIIVYNFGATNYDYYDIAEIRAVHGKPCDVSNNYSRAIKLIRSVCEEYGYQALFGTHKSGTVIKPDLQPVEMHPRTHIAVSWNVLHEGKWCHIPSIETEEALEIHQQLSFGALISVEREGLGARHYRYQYQDDNLYNHLSISAGRDSIYRVAKEKDEYRCPGLLPDMLVDLTLLIGGGRYSRRIIGLNQEMFARAGTERIANFSGRNSPDLMVLLQTGSVSPKGVFNLSDSIKQGGRNIVSAIAELLDGFWPDNYSIEERTKIYSDFHRLFSAICIVDNRLNAKDCDEFVHELHPVISTAWQIIKPKIEAITLSGIRECITIPDVGRRQVRLAYVDENARTSKESAVLGDIIGSEKENLIQQSLLAMNQRHTNRHGQNHVLWEIRGIITSCKEKNPSLTSLDMMDLLATELVEIIQIAPRVNFDKVVSNMVNYAAKQGSKSRSVWGEELADLIVAKYSLMINEAKVLAEDPTKTGDSNYSPTDKILLLKMAHNIKPVEQLAVLLTKQVAEFNASKDDRFAWAKSILTTARQGRSLAGES